MDYLERYFNVDVIFMCYRIIVVNVADNSVVAHRSVSEKVIFF